MFIVAKGSVLYTCNGHSLSISTQESFRGPNGNDLNSAPWIKSFHLAHKSKTLSQSKATNSGTVYVHVHVQYV